MLRLTNRLTRLGYSQYTSSGCVKFGLTKSLSSSSVLYATPSDAIVDIPSPSHVSEKTHRSGTTNIPRKPNTTADHLETNAASETNRLEKTLERFWEKVSVGERARENPNVSDYVILLDNKAIKTPVGNSLVVPKEKKALAHLIAHEWRILPSLKIKPHLVPLTSLASRAIDLIDGNADVSFQESGKCVDPAVLNNIIDALLPYLDTDTLLIFSPHSDCEGELRVGQEEEYRPLISLAEKFWSHYSTDKKPITLKWLDTDTMGFATNRQSAEAKAAVTNWIKSLDPWDLVSLERATMSSKSLIIGMLIATGQISVKEAVRVSTLETIFQTKVWGEVEDSHDVDSHDIRRTLASAYILASEH